MLTINTSLSEGDIKWFNLSSSPFEDVSPENKNLFSPSLTVEMLSPPCITEKAASPRLWETPCGKGTINRSSMLRDCYLDELSSSLETATHKALHVLKNKRNRNIDNKDIAFVIDNAINSEVRCSNLSTRHLDEIKKKLERMAIQSLSSPMVKEAGSVE